MSFSLKFLLFSSACLILGGCQTIKLPSLSGKSKDPAPLTQPAPQSLSVPQNTLTPQAQEAIPQAPSLQQTTPESLQQQESAQNTAPKNTLAAQTQPTANATIDVKRDDLVGGWTIRSANVSCPLFLSLTSWTGGYRATARSCSDGDVVSISAWNIQERQVSFFNAEGGLIARLFPASATQFNGQFENGKAVSFSR